MAYEAPFLRLSYGGAVRADDEWVNNISIIPATLPNDAVEGFNEINLASLKAFIDTAYTGPNGMAPFINLGWYKLALIGTDGKYLADAKYIENVTPIVGTNTSVAVSPQDSVVISFRTGITRGLANRGRIYPPAGFAAPSNATGLISQSTQTALVTRFVTMLNGINTYLDTLDAVLDVGIVSKEREGATQKVLRVEVGNIMDNQNRRRNKLSENYEGSNLS